MFAREFEDIEKYNILHESAWQFPAKILIAEAGIYPGSQENKEKLQVVFVLTYSGAPYILRILPLPLTYTNMDF